jgi:hypothetical protein
MRKAPFDFERQAMSWKYSQSTDKLASPAGSGVAIGYSGRGVGLNNSSEQAAHGVGVIPQGDWEIGRFFDDPGGKGLCVAHLTPLPGTHTFGRAGFMIHGDNSLGNHTASEGCIVLPRVAREMMRSSEDRVLSVTE